MSVCAADELTLSPFGDDVCQPGSDGWLAGLPGEIDSGSLTALKPLTERSAYALHAAVARRCRSEAQIVVTEEWAEDPLLTDGGKVINHTMSYWLAAHVSATRGWPAAATVFQVDCAGDFSTNCGNLQEQAPSARRQALGLKSVP